VGILGNLGVKSKIEDRPLVEILMMILVLWRDEKEEAFVSVALDRHTQAELKTFI